MTLLCPSPLKASSLLACALLGVLGTVTAARTQIPGTLVSYDYQRSGGKNTSVVYVTADSDKSGKTYIARYCENDGDLLFSSVPLGNKAGAEIYMDLKEDSGAQFAFNRYYGKLQPNKANGKLTVLETKDKSNAYLRDYVSSGRGPFSLTIHRAGLSPLKVHFSSKGFDKALTAIKNCQ